MNFYVNSSSTQQAAYNSVIVAVCGGYVWLGYSQPAGQLIRALGQTSGPPLSATSIVSIAILNQHDYIVDGVNGIIDVDLLSGSVIPYVVQTGTAPVTPTLAANWRGRLMLNSSTNPQNLYAARISNPYDWNFSATDSAAAFVDDPATSGRIGEPITALIPYTDDYFIIGASHSMFMYQGDPAAGGTNTYISQNMGVVGKDAWTVDPEGTLYYIGTGGLFSVKPIWEFYRPPENISRAKYNQFFQFLNPGTQIISLVWDADLHYLHMLVSPIGGATQGLSLIYDGRKGGLWPQQFPANIGPACSLLFIDNNDPNQRAILLGGFDGYIRRFIIGAANTTSFDDDGTAIQASVTLGPIAPFPGAALLTGLTIDLGELGPNQPEPSIGTQTDNFTGDGSTVQFNLTYNGINDTMTATVAGVDVPNNPYNNPPNPGTFLPAGDLVQFGTAPANGAAIAVTYDYVISGTQYWSAQAQVNSGPDAFSVTEGTPHSFYTVMMPLDRRQKCFRQRLRGRWFTITLSNGADNTYFSFESAIAEFDQGGRQRTIR